MREHILLLVMELARERKSRMPKLGRVRDSGVSEIYLI